MRFVFFYHSLVSDWNHGNAHFLRGIATELRSLGHQVVVFEPENGWSRTNLVADHGSAAIERFHRAYPWLAAQTYDESTLDLDEALRGADVVVVHEWNTHALVQRIGEHRATRGEYTLFFHDTHHRSVTAPREMAAYDLRHYDAVLAFGDVVRKKYLESGWARRAFTWHEAADRRLFLPRIASRFEGDVVWIGNFGDDERTAELHEFLLDPVRELGLTARVHGVRYPEAARDALARAGIEYGGYLPNWEVPDVYAKFRIAIHVPRGPYVRSLPGIPTIRPFEALACGKPLVSAPWSDTEGLFEVGQDFLVAHDRTEMKSLLRKLLDQPHRAAQLGEHGLATVRARHTCRHRAAELLMIEQTVRAAGELGRPAPHAFGTTP